MVGVEDSCAIEGNLLRLITEYKSECESKYGIEMPLYLHCGESIVHHNNNLDIVLQQVQGVRRIGHGTQLVIKPHLIDTLKHRDIPVEVCPLSNQLLNYTKNI